MKNRALYCRPELLRVLAASMLAYAGMFVSEAHAAVGLASEGKLTVGIEYVVPAFVDGAKVRTPEGVDMVLADDLARRLSAVAQTTSLAGINPSQALDGAKAKLLLVPVGDAGAIPSSAAIVPTGYAAGAMAIMRSDTDIKNWQQLKGRSVCVAEGGRHVGQIAAKYGAVEKVFKAPADSLLALRTGGCDAAVHDSAMLNELLKLPEWKKFSARLPVQDLMPLAFVVADSDAESVSYLRQVVKDWASSRYLEKVTKVAVRDIAFEVYLDQTVTDCH